MRLHTTEPGMQLYFGNFLGGEFAPFSALCMEPQHYPDSPNHPLFPSTILLPGEEYFQSTVYRFDTLPVHSAK
jgi:aldose 1-epimerase